MLANPEAERYLHVAKDLVIEVVDYAYSRH